MIDFSRIAKGYDRCNHMMSGGLDVLWRRRSVAMLASHARMLDLACGTGDSCVALHRRFPSAEISGVDLSSGMLEIARRKCPYAHFAVGDVLAADWGSPDAITCAFGFRNFPDKEAVLRSAADVLPSGGELLVLEFWRPKNRFIGGCVSLWLRIFTFLFAGSRRAEYNYLRRSIETTLSVDEFISCAASAGLVLKRRINFFPSATALLFVR